MQLKMCWCILILNVFTIMQGSCNGCFDWKSNPYCHASERNNITIEVTAEETNLTQCLGWINVTCFQEFKGFQIKIMTQENAERMQNAFSHLDGTALILTLKVPDIFAYEDHNEPLKKLVKWMINLQHLHVAETRSICAVCFANDFMPRLDTNDLRVLNMSNMQSVSSSAFQLGMNLNFTQFFSNGTEWSQTLQVLDLSRNDFLTVSGTLCPFVPSLRFLDISFNRFSHVDSFFLPSMLIHPRLEILHMEMQQGLASTYGKTWIDQKMFAEVYKVPRKILSEHTCYLNYWDLEHQHFGLLLLVKSVTEVIEYEIKQCLHIGKGPVYQCANLTTHLVMTLGHALKQASNPLGWTAEKTVDIMENLVIPTIKRNSSLLSRESLCHCLRYFWRNLAGIDCTQIPTVDELVKLYNPGCTPPLHIPLLPALREGYADGLAIGVNVLDVTHIRNMVKDKHVKPLCFVPTPLRLLSLSKNEEWLTPFLGVVRDVYNSSGRAYLPRITGISNLTDIRISNNNVKNLYSEVLQTLPNNTEHLDMSGNDLNINQSICHRQRQLKTLDLSHNSQTSLNKVMFSECKNLTKVDMSYNLITEIDLQLPDNTDKTVLAQQPQFLLNLSYNQIRSFNKESQELLERYTVAVDLQGNPLDCECTGEHFLRWLHTTTSVTSENRDLYSCSSGIKASSVNLDHLHKRCRSSLLVGLEFAAVATALTVFVLTSSYFGYRYRFKLQTWYLRCKLRHPTDPASHTYLYDAFLCYVAEDRFWTHAVLVKKLEDKYGFKLCVHYRDFLAGGFIMDAITEHMAASRTTIVVLSKRALQKPLFLFECNFADHMATLGTKPHRLIVIQQGHLPRSSVTDMVERLRQRYTILTWPDDLSGSDDVCPLDDIQQPSSEDTSVLIDTNTTSPRNVSEKAKSAQQLFWYKLRSALYKSILGDDSSGCLSCLERCGSKTDNILPYADIEGETLSLRSPVV